jgi:hypothetical protein
MYSNSYTEDRAVTTELRNFIHIIGGAFGLVISGVILSNTLRNKWIDKSFVSNSVITQLTSSNYALNNLYSPRPAETDSRYLHAGAAYSLDKIGMSEYQPSKAGNLRERN